MKIQLAKPEHIDAWMALVEHIASAPFQSLPVRAITLPHDGSVLPASKIRQKDLYYIIHD